MPHLPARDTSNAGTAVPTVFWVMVGVVALLFGWLHWEFIFRSTLASIGDPNWSHIAVVPAISAYYIYLNRDRVLAQPARLFWPGLIVVFMGVFSYLVWLYPGRNDMFRGYSMILSLVGVVLFTQGWSRMKVLWFPIAYLVFAVKIPDSIWEKVAFQLTIVASAGSEIMLDIASQLLDFQIIKQGQSFMMTWYEDGQKVEHGFDVAGACSGLRMLMAFCALGVAMAFLWDRTWWQRLIMVLMAVPIAVGVNIARVTTLGLLNLVDPAYSKGDFHIFVGMAMLVPAAILFLGLGKLLDMMVIRDEDDGLPPAPATDGDPVLPTRDGGAAGDVAWPRLIPGFVMGALLAVLVGLVYVFWLNGYSANPIFDRLSPVVSFVIAGVSLAGAVVVFKLFRGNVTTLLGGMVVIAGVMLTSAIGLQSVVAATKTALFKQAVEMRHGFFMLPRTMGQWEFVGEDEPLDKYVEDELGTDKYITRTYRDTTLEEDDAASVVRVHIAYYTGMIDTVPHVADRCWVASGITPSGSRGFSVPLDLASGTPDPDHGGFILPTQLVDPVSGQARARVPQDVVPVRSFTGLNPENNRELRATYFFVANGSYYASPNDVRKLGFDPRDRYSYYCKVDVTFPFLDDQERTDEQTAAFLSDLMPEVMACLPDWVDVSAGLWPSGGKAASPSPDPAPAEAP